jgi:hypothetical protein
MTVPAHESSTPDASSCAQSSDAQDDSGASSQDIVAAGKQLRCRVARAIGDAFTLYTEQQQQARHTVFGLSMSGLGACRRRSAYQLAKVAPSDPELAMSGQKRPANLGTMIHAGLLPALATVLGGHEEIPIDLVVPVDDGVVHIPGRTDMYWPEARCLLDLKTVGEHKLADRVAYGVPQDHQLQVSGYAMGAEQNGHPVDWVGWVYLDRASGEDYVIIEAFTDEHRGLVADRCRELVNYATSPADAPRDGPGPGVRAANAICNSCAWLKECWGPTAAAGVPGAQSSRVEDFGGMQQVLIGYLHARDDEKSARQRKEFYRELITGNAPGVYGRARWLMSKPSSAVDGAACAEIVRAAGLSVPMKPNEPRLVVAWVIPDQTEDDIAQGGEQT